MSANVEQLERSIRELPLADMVSLHERLISVIHEAGESAGLDSVFREEISQRVASIESGHAKGVDAFEALRKI